MAVGPDRVCVVVGRTRHKMMQVELDEAAKRGAQFVELRLDFLKKAVEFKRLVEHKHGPWVATFRRSQDGGRWAGTEEERQAILRQAIVSGHFDWVDLETDVADTIRRYGPVKRIVSYHHLTETPANLEERFEKMLAQDADVYKIAVTAQTPSDILRIVALQKSATKPTIAFCMGEIGFPSRFLSLKYGAPWIYCAFNKERGVAPGIPGHEDFRTTYPFRAINAATAIYGVIGDPVSHSFSPVLHNHMYQRLKVNAICLPFRIPKELLDDSLNALDGLPVRGYSVTIPHKEAVARYAREADETVRLTKAANTLVRFPEGGFHASNTDFAAALDSIRTHMNERTREGDVPKLSQVSVLILGAGGVARAIAHALHQEGAALTITARTNERAMKLAEEVKCRIVDWQARHNINCDIAINCTPVGMHPDVDHMPIHASFLRPGLTVFDTVYTPETTLLLREAKSRGCFTISGVEMFIRQAAGQIAAFTGQEPPLDRLRSIMRKALSPISRALEDEAKEGAVAWEG
ncbi:MAG TPA: shikimate dehydrogenase [Fimbriiglobus sp.]|jgi:3-dehydroquinate dehydratase/shikimate dehydrogenase